MWRKVLVKWNRGTIICLLSEVYDESAALTRLTGERIDKTFKCDIWME